MNRSKLVPFAVAGALFLLYIEFAYELAQSGLVQNAPLLQQGIFTLQFAKIACLSAFGRFRNTRAVNVVNLLGAEVVVALPALAIAAVFFGSSGASSLLSQVFLAWVAGASASGAPYSIYRLTRAMIRGEPLLIVLPTGIVISEFLLLLQSGTASAASSGEGLVGISRTIILLGGGAIAAGAQLQGSLILVPLSVFYVALLLHGLAPGRETLPSKSVAIIGLAVMVTALTYAGILVASVYAFPFTYFVLAPTLVTAGLLWWSTREK